ncbi:MAG: arginase [Ignavibacteriales bacterium]|jgi:arginase (EC 3.5.3.1)|nr:MAG: arginase [Ignavibacteriaceae bacterium]MBW7872130.1 arginase [Ignavibacteria bacterium]MCZ2143764.1 arginase [Ignavibacteriales bacterium]MBV6445976.1 Arginase [Ignavibacteriaceae bacterium]MBZ0197743.1 arginase [Ignavibacteriaceae bacterium]
MKRKVRIIGFPMDLGAGRRGVDMGPSALRIAQLSEKLEELGYEVDDLGDIDVGIMETEAVKDDKLKYIDEIERTSLKLAKVVEETLEAEDFPLCIGGDHSMALGTLGGIASYCRKRGQSLGVIWIDAHTDMNSDKTTPSGNIHGMSLAASLGIGHPRLVDLYGEGPKLNPEDVVVIGARSIDKEERINIQKSGITVYTMSDIDKMGIHRIVTKVLKQFKNKVDHIHVSFDVDSVDPTILPGVGTPVPGGLNYREAHLLMETIAECGCMSSLEITEINPILDTKNNSAVFAVGLVASSMGLRIL